MTPQEIEFCIRDFYATHKVAPVILVVGDRIYDSLLAHCTGNLKAETVYFQSLQVLRDPTQPGLVVSS